MSKPVIVIVENSVQVTGAFNSVMRSSQFLKDRFDFVFVVPTSAKVIPILEAAGFRVHELTYKELRKSIYSFVIYVPVLIVNAIKLLRLARSVDARVIHVNDIYNLTPALAWFFGAKQKIIVHIRFMPNRFPHWMFNLWWRIYSRCADQFVAVSNAVAELLPTREKTVVIYDPLPAGLNAKLQQKISNETRFLYLSNYIPGKGQEVALRAFYQAFQINPGIKIRFVGSDMGLKKNRDFKVYLQKLGEELLPNEVIEWADFTSDVESEIMNADVVLNFSNSESLSLTCIEGMYVGKPVIATASGGPQELIEHLKSGYIVPVGDINAMTKAMLELAGSTKLSNDLAQGGYYSIREKLSENNTVSQLCKCYSSPYELL